MIRRNYKVFIICPACIATGGTEVLHQLHAKLIERSVSSFLYYINQHPESKESITPDRFRKYIKSSEEVTSNIEDISNNYLIVPEVFIASVTYKKINLCYWWLSVNNFFISNYVTLDLYLNPTWKMIIKRIINWYPYHFFDKKINQPNVFINLYQSDYARDFLLSCFKIKNTKPLGDFINPEIVNKTQNIKENIILYYPNKGMEITKALISVAPKHFIWKPVTNMSPSEIAKLMGRAKIYVDFGTHPGKDRIPREAASNHCIVITNREGSARNDVDIPILPKYKFENPINSQKEIFDLIEDIFSNFAQHELLFQSYRKEVERQENEFDRQIDQLIDLFDSKTID